MHLLSATPLIGRQFCLLILTNLTWQLLQPPLASQHSLPSPLHFALQTPTACTSLTVQMKHDTWCLWAVLYAQATACHHYELSLAVPISGILQSQVLAFLTEVGVFIPYQASYIRLVMELGCCCILNTPLPAQHQQAIGSAL